MLLFAFLEFSDGIGELSQELIIMLISFKILVILNKQVFLMEIGQLVKQMRGSNLFAEQTGIYKPNTGQNYYDGAPLYDYSQ